MIQFYQTHKVKLNFFFGHPAGGDRPSGGSAAPRRIGPQQPHRDSGLDRPDYCSLGSELACTHLLLSASLRSSSQLTISSAHLTPHAGLTGV